MSDDAVYQAHRAKILGDTKVLEPKEYHPMPRDPQGDTLDAMNAYAKQVIPNEDAKTMNCATFTNFNLICEHIRRTSNIKGGSVYSSLRYIGEMKCYSDYRQNGSDVFSEINKYTDICAKSFDIDKMLAVQRSHPIFVDVRTVKHRVNKVVHKIMMDFSVECGIQTSHLNLYHAMHGLKVLCENDIVYSVARDVPVFEKVLDRISDVDKSLNARRVTMEALARM